MPRRDRTSIAHRIRFMHIDDSGAFCAPERIAARNIVVSLWHSRIHAEDAKNATRKMLDQIDMRERAGALTTNRPWKSHEVPSSSHARVGDKHPDAQKGVVVLEPTRNFLPFVRVVNYDCRFRSAREARASISSCAWLRIGTRCDARSHRSTLRSGSWWRHRDVDPTTCAFTQILAAIVLLCIR